MRVGERGDDRGVASTMVRILALAARAADTILDRGKRFDPQVLVTEVRNEILKPAVPSGERFILTVLGDDSPP